MRKGKDAEDGAAGRGSLDPPTPALTPFERFEEFARKVISVPKSVIDERDRAARPKPNGSDRKRPA
jgi:hypothetical protein